MNFTQQPKQSVKVAAAEVAFRRKARQMKEGDRLSNHSQTQHNASNLTKDFPTTFTAISLVKMQLAVKFECLCLTWNVVHACF